jgi:hypothetical protein
MVSQEENSNAWPLAVHARAEAKHVKIYGQPALGFHRLLVSIELELATGGPDRKATLTPYGGELLVQGNGGSPHHVGRLEPVSNTLHLDARGRTATDTLTFGVELDQLRLKALEDLRHGGDLRFTPRLLVLLHRGGGYPPAHQQLEPTQPYLVNPSEWAKIREQMNAGRTLLCEIPEPDAESSPQLSQAVRYWEEGWRAWLRRDYAEAVGRCRLVLESLSGALGDPDEPGLRALIETRQAREAMDKPARLLVVRKALTHLCHPPHHPGDITWVRQDAEFVIRACAAVLQLYSTPR